MIDCTAVLTTHREGSLAGLSLRSLADAADAARAAGWSVEVLAMLDRPDAATRALFADTNVALTLMETDHGDQGAVRNDAARAANGRFLAFLDGDDLWSENWLAAGLAEATRTDPPAVVHPEVNWFFGEQNNLFFKTGDDDPFFSADFLRFGNYWDAMMIVERAALIRLPFSPRDLPAGYAYEDWYWAAASHAAGLPHRVAPGTIHFKRRREGSQHGRSVASAALPPMAPPFRYDWYG